jgi:hypothetical protein
LQTRPRGAYSSAMPDGTEQPVIRYVPMGTITVYWVSEDELRLIETGGPSSVYLNFAIALLSIGGTFLASLALSDVRSMKVFVVFVVLMVVSLLAGLILLVLWRRASRSSQNTIQAIRSRDVPPEGTPGIEGRGNP